MSEYIIEIPDEYFASYDTERDMYYPDERDSAMRITPIVRCRDCKHMHTVRHWSGIDINECWLHADPESGALGKEPIEPDGFCAWGEKASNFTTCKCGEDIETNGRESVACPSCGRVITE